MSHLSIFHFYGDVTITSERLQYLALGVFDQGGMFTVQHLLCHRASVFPVSSEWPPHSIYLIWQARSIKDLFYSGSSQGLSSEFFFVGFTKLKVIGVDCTWQFLWCRSQYKHVHCYYGHCIWLCLYTVPLAITYLQINQWVAPVMMTCHYYVWIWNV
jgi:hypothetical protein